ncbi:hypothetical protein SAE02_61820 [Skermanella aerolata]|uniref:Uncharacterized protein n=1 Tax=Skermanella aerolata TaxID=393310 RepID=A0A512DZY0_9PROT|nr:hypothetical protein SAE02_61820 [Skermanella aerolata]
MPSSLVYVQTVRCWRRRWDDEPDLALADRLADALRPGMPPTFTAEQICAIVRNPVEPSARSHSRAAWENRRLFFARGGPRSYADMIGMIQGWYDSAPVPSGGTGSGVHIQASSKGISDPPNSPGRDRSPSLKWHWLHFQNGQSGDTRTVPLYVSSGWR